MNAHPKAGDLAPEEASATRVGYGQPPRAHQFKKGASGNPNGRPRKKKPAASADTGGGLDAIILAEGRRMVSYMEGGEVKEAPAIQLLIRRLVIDGIQGDLKLIAAFLKLYEPAEEREQAGINAAERQLVDYKKACEARARECEILGKEMPTFVPHPNDLAFDRSTGEVKFNGPRSPEEKEIWDSELHRKTELEGRLRYLKTATNRMKKKQAHAETMREHQEEIDVIDRTYPDEETRRQPEFDLETWRRDQAKAQRKRDRELAAAEAAAAQAKMTKSARTAS